MIKSFKNKGLKELFIKGRSKKVASDLGCRAIRRLDVLNSAKSLKDLNIPGFDFHGLEGKPKRYSLHVSGNWCVTFEFKDSDAYKVNLEDYH